MFYLVRGLIDSGHEALLVCQPDGIAARRAMNQGLPLAAVKMRGEMDVLAANKIASLARENRCDIIHAHTSHAHSLAVLANMAIRNHSRVIVHRRVDFSIHKQPLGLSLWKYRIGVDRYIAISDEIKNVLVRDGVPARKIDVVRSCTDLRRFENVARANLRDEFGLPPDALIVGNVAALVGHKDHATLVRAAAIVLQTHPEAYFIVAGEGELRPSIERLRDELGIGGHFILAGFRTDVPSMLADFDILAMSSCMEGLGSALLEAMAMGCPIATTNAGGIKEIVTDGLNGLVVAVRDPKALARAIMRLIREPQLRRQIALTARKTVEQHFSTDVLLAETLKVYERVLGRPTRVQERSDGSHC